MTERLLLRALRREPTERAPVWLMRQAGRYLPEYRKVRAEAGGFLEMVHRPEYAAEVTLQPIRRYDMDAAILFSDILIPLDAMGLSLGFDQRGPYFDEPVRTPEAVDALKVVEPSTAMPYVGEALQLVRKGLPDDKALLGFCGAPFTLASYAIEGGTSKSFLELRKFMVRETKAFETLMEKLADQVAQHLAFQIDSGADAVQIFDTWAGILTREDYDRFAAPWTKRALAAIAGRAPRVIYVHGGDHLVESVFEHDCECVSVDHRTPIERAFELAGDRRAVQGNLDPTILLDTPDTVRARTSDLLGRVGGRPGHLLNLGHGVFKDTDPAAVGAFVETALAAR